MRSELKPCPFCGGEDLDVHVGASFGRLHENVTITCNDCIGSIYGGTEQRAIAAWNTRAERTCTVKPHGYLIINGEDSDMRCWSCSECAYGWHISDYDKQFSYCPNCGAEVVEQ